MSRTLILITGASRGFGRCLALSCIALATKHAQPVDFVLTARDTALLATVRSQLLQKSSTKQVNVITHAADFAQSDPTALDALCADLLHAIPNPPDKYSHVYLFNNAGSLGKLDRLRTQTAADIMPAVLLNLTAPLVLTAAFLRAFQPTATRKIVVVNISSLAAVQPFDCWGVYCAVKAARDMFHRTFAVEQGEDEKQQQQHNASSSSSSSALRVLNYAPGPLDTDMQTRIRDEMPQVPLRDVYVKMHDEQNLVDPQVSADVLVEHLLLKENAFENGAHVDIYDIDGWQKK
ncbi:hypothetical protein HDU87_007452 [Geranomyces variabilis]|uniref:Sepiapterin reductase n=1 Tax=Geranomyces variabilis TaxID=109894 RepID=A0AAD5TQ51_9FUNG|nr:hypothetical protein HDU87_007452 [Geranomyces variabilis]